MSGRVRKAGVAVGLAGLGLSLWAAYSGAGPEWACSSGGCGASGVVKVGWLAVAWWAAVCASWLRSRPHPVLAWSGVGFAGVSLVMQVLEGACGVCLVTCLLIFLTAFLCRGEEVGNACQG